MIEQGFRIKLLDNNALTIDQAKSALKLEIFDINQKGRFLNFVAS